MRSTRIATEYVDAIAPDGSMLMFSRVDHPDNTGDPEFYDVWFSERKPDGSWSTATNPRKPLNTETHNFGVAIGQDINTVYMQGIYNADGTSSTGGGVSYSTRTLDGWSKPTVMKIPDYYNHASYLNSHVSPDGKVLVLSVWRDDTEGGNDLYVCFRTEDEKLGRHQRNMGDVINTPW